MIGRLATSVWVSALVRRSFAQGGAAVVRRRGDAHAGTVLLLVRDRLGGLLALTPTPNRDGSRCWRNLAGPGALSDVQADALIARQAGFDPDLWVVELEGVALDAVLDEQYVVDK